MDSAEAASANADRLAVSIPHVALTNRAFESTQVAKISHLPLSESEIELISKWKDETDKEVSDRSIRLMLGLR